MTRSLLVTGGAGYLGSHILHRLADLTQFNLKQHFDRIDVIDNLSTGFAEALPEACTQQDNSIFRFHKFDLTDSLSCKSFFTHRNYDAIIHLAGMLNASESVLYPISYYETNIRSLLNILNSLSTTHRTRFIFSSTAAVYGKTENLAPVNEESPLAPSSPYGFSKLLCEQMLKDYQAANPLFKFVALRYFNIAGAADNLQNGQRTTPAYHLVHVAAKVALGLLPALHIYGDKRPTPDGTCIRDYIHVEDLVDLHLLALEYLSNNQPSCALNCGYQMESSVKNIIASMEIAANTKINCIVKENRPGDPDFAVASNQKILSTFGWRPQRNNVLNICKSALDWERKLKLH